MHDVLCVVTVAVAVQPSGQCYKGSVMHRVVPGQCVQGGKLNAGGRGSNVGASGSVFDDESFEMGHDRGVLSMANDGADRNGSQFFVCLKRLKAWDGKHVVFGRVLSGLKVSVLLL